MTALFIKMSLCVYTISGSGSGRAEAPQSFFKRAPGRSVGASARSRKCTRRLRASETKDLSLALCFLIFDFFFLSDFLSLIFWPERQEPRPKRGLRTPPMVANQSVGNKEINRAKVGGTKRVSLRSHELSCTFTDLVRSDIKFLHVCPRGPHGPSREGAWKGHGRNCSATRAKPTLFRTPSNTGPERNVGRKTKMICSV